MPKDPGKPPATEAARTAAKLPGVAVGIACEGTSLESRTFTVNGKAFLFVRPAALMLKLSASLPEAIALSKAAPIKAGAGGWVTLTGPLPTTAMLTRWIKESHGLMASGGPAKKPKATRPAPTAKRRST